MNQNTNTKMYDLEERTFQFAKNVRTFIKRIPRTLSNLEDAKQLVRSSGSVAANYIEANESLSKKDFLMRVKISKKEAKESRMWLKILDLEDDEQLTKSQQQLIQESLELMKILGAILEKSV